MANQPTEISMKVLWRKSEESGEADDSKCESYR